MRKEIGSYFTMESEFLSSKESELEWIPTGHDYTFTFSGRSALELAIKDIQSTKNVQNVYMPAYCCESMIQPFKNAGIKVEFYDVYHCEDKGIQFNVDEGKECDIFFFMSYFGLENFMMDDILNIFKKNKTIIIEDITHRLLSEINHSTIAHYTIASIRKWLGVPSGGIITKKDGELYKKPSINSDDLVFDVIDAMDKKKKYLKRHTSNKKIFLTRFNDFELNLSSIDFTYKIDKTSQSIIEHIDLGNIRKRRRENARKLYQELEHFNNIHLLIPKYHLNNCPLFVPIMIKDGKRDKLRKYLVKRDIYLPVHWPISKLHENLSQKTKNIYSNVLSIVCDQRYDETDMDRIIQTIKEFYVKEKSN